MNGEPSARYPNPSLFLTTHDELQATPKKRRSPAKRKTENMKIRKLNGNQISVSPSEKFTDLTREYDIRFYTGLINQDLFRTLFEFLKLKASTMTYWNKKNTIRSSSFEICCQVQELILKSWIMLPQNQGHQENCHLKQNFF